MDVFENKQIIGRVTFANGEKIEYSDPIKYLKTVKEELPYRATSGFGVETLTRDPKVRKAVDDMIYDLYGVKNPCKLEEYHKQPEHNVTITEELRMVVPIEAASTEEAKQKAEDNWKDGEYILDADHFVGVFFTIEDEDSRDFSPQKVPAKLDRSQWKGCKYCIADQDGYSTCFIDKIVKSTRMYIPEREAAIVLLGKYNYEAYIRISYCPHCGRPLTEEAWAEMEMRINNGTAD